MTDRASLRAQGEAMRRRLFGDGDDGAPANMRTLNTEAVYGAIWSRPGLALDDRMVCALAALGCGAAPAQARPPCRRSPRSRPVGPRDRRDPGPDRHLCRLRRVRGGGRGGRRSVRRARHRHAGRDRPRGHLETLTERGAGPDATASRRARNGGLRRARQQGHRRALSVRHSVRLRRDLVPARPRSEAAGAWSRWRRSPRCSSTAR